jgi:phosphopantothenoylcysteine decarboxylase/phosphopantothenate--cysteine ligase
MSGTANESQRKVPREVVLGVSGGIAAYKAASLLRLFTESGDRVTVVPTASALNFVGAATWEALSGRPVSTDVFDNVDSVQHVRVGQHADLVVVAPATANTLAKAAHGLADDLLTTTLLASRAPVVFAPAMHTEMWENPATQANVRALRERGYVVLDPAVGRLTGVDSGSGRLPEPEEIFAACQDIMSVPRDADLRGQRVVVSAGGTREYLDPVRFIGNRSSGRQGYALAKAAASRGATVTLVAANVTLPDPAGVTVERVVTTAELRTAVLAAAGDADAVIMAAAPADFRPVAQASSKIKKTHDGTAPHIDLVENPDILAELVQTRTSKRPIIVGFAAETGDADGSVMDHARSKLERKGCDLLVVNDVSEGRVFNAADSEAVIIGADGFSRAVPPGPKADIAHAVWDAVVGLMA